MKKILVPVDFSKQSREAFRVAIELVAKNNGEITMLHVLPLPTVYDSGFPGEPLIYNPVYLDQMEDEARREMEKMKSDAKSNVKINIEVAFGEVVSSIKNNITTFQCDLIVMGSSGGSAIPMFIGSTTEKVVRHASVPVLAVREHFRADDIKNILLPSNLDLNQTDFIAALKTLQAFFNATLHILLINTPAHFMRDEEAQRALQDFIAWYKLTNCKTYFCNYRTEEEGIIDFAYREKINMIAMATHGRKGLSHLFNGSIAEDVVNEIMSPVWTYSLKHPS